MPTDFSADLKNGKHFDADSQWGCSVTIEDNSYYVKDDTAALVHAILLLRDDLCDCLDKIKD